MGHEGLISESKRVSPRLDKTPTSTKSMGLPRPVVSESKTTNSPPDKRERAQRMASSLLSIRAGEAPVGMLIELPILLSSSHGEYLMEYRRLGRSGLFVSALTLGTMTFGGRGAFSKVGSTDVAGARRHVDM